MKQDPLPSNLVTLEEMRNIFLNNPNYAEFRERLEKAYHIPSGGEAKIPYVMTWQNPRQPLLYRHIAAEQMFQGDREKVNWQELTDFEPHSIVPLVELLMNPLVWTDGKPHLKDMVVEGRIAKPQFMEDRQDLVYDLVRYLLDEGLLKFADNPDIIEEDDPDEGYLKGMHYWMPLTMDYEPLIYGALNGEHYSFNTIVASKAYDAISLRKRLDFIAEERGGKRAAELLRFLQKEWKNIKIWKTELKHMSEEDIKRFEHSLLNGFDDLLEQWEAEQSKTQKSKKEKRPTTKSITFKMGSISDGHLQMLRLKLIDVGWIANDTQPDDFTKLFSGKTNTIKITWTGIVGKGMLRFLFTKMAEQRFIIVPDSHSIDTILENHFIDTDGNYLSGLNSSKESIKHLPVVKECLDILQLEVDTD